MQLLLKTTEEEQQPSTKINMVGAVTPVLSELGGIFEVDLEKNKEQHWTTLLGGKVVALARVQLNVMMHRCWSRGGDVHQVSPHTPVGASNCDKLDQLAVKNMFCSLECDRQKTRSPSKFGFFFKEAQNMGSLLIGLQ